MAPILFAFVAGVFVLHASPALPPAAAATVVAAAFVVAVVQRANAMAAFACGWLVAFAAAYTVLTDRLPASRHGEDAVVTGTVSSLPDRRQSGARFEFKPDRALHPDLPRTIRVAWHLDAPPPEAGSQWRLALRLRAPRGALNPDAFDYEQWLTARRIGATAVVRDRPAPEPLADGRSLRAHVDRRLTDSLGEHPRRGIVRGLSVGERGELGNHEWEVFARTGTAHLMAISGLHVGMVAALAFGVGAWCARRVPVARDRAREVGVACGLLAAATYAALAGFAIPTRRALCMLAVGAVWVCARRTGVAFGAWTGALVVVLATDPLSPLTIGFWLSFGAVAVIVWHVADRRRAPPALVQLVRVQWAVALGLLPLTLWFFQRGSLAAPAANLIAVPWFTTVVVPSVLAGAGLAALDVPGAAHWLAAVATLLDVTWAGLETIARWPWAQRFTPRPAAWTVVAALCGAAVLLAPRGLPGRALIGAVLCAPMLAWRPDAPPPGGWRLTVLDAGQGLASVVQTHAHVMVYDTGPRYGPHSDAGSRIVVPYLRARGVRKVDLLVVSHPHEDHQGGVASVRDALPVAAVIAGDPTPLRPPAAHCVAGMRWNWDGVDFHVLHPSAPGGGNPNLDSCVVEVAGVGGRALLPGDVEWQAELMLARPGSPLRPVDVVVAPHHGSDTSSTPRFVARTVPRYVIVPAGYANRWNFPAERVVGRWRGVGAEVLMTGDHGAVSIDAVPGVGVSAPFGERAGRRAWWRAD